MRDDDTNNAIVQRVLRESRIPELIEVLTERVSPTDLQSLLLEIYKRRASKLSAPAVLKRYKENRFVRPASISPQQFIELDQLAYSLLPNEFEPVELSPVSPLGACSALATVDQNNIVATIRNTEVCSDSTNVLALECATRRKQSRGQKEVRDIKLCASQRLLRGQLFKGPGMVQHFRVFSLCTAGTDKGNCVFETEALFDQIDFHIRLLLESRRIGFRVGLIRATITPFAGGRGEVLEREVIRKLAQRHPEVRFEFDQERESGRGYYVWAGFQVMATDSGNKEWFLVDGGFTNWTQLLLSNRKERLLISGLGTERFLAYFSAKGRSNV